VVHQLTADELERSSKVLEVVSLDQLELLARRLKSIMVQRGFGSVTLTVSKSHLHLLQFTQHEPLPHQDVE
jgi:hypothetical protein